MVSESFSFCPVCRPDMAGFHLYCPIHHASQWKCCFRWSKPSVCGLPYYRWAWLMSFPRSKLNKNVHTGLWLNILDAFIHWHEEEAGQAARFCSPVLHTFNIPPYCVVRRISFPEICLATTRHDTTTAQQDVHKFFVLDIKPLQLH